MSPNIAILTLAGSSTRFGGSESKVLCKVKGIPLFVYPLTVLNDLDLINQIILVIRLEDKQKITDIIRNRNLDKKVTIVIGGSSRSESVKNALNLIPDDCNVLICDGDRPNQTAKMFEENIKALETNAGVVTAIKAIDSIFGVYNNSLEYLDRSKIYQAQTPQSFKGSVIKKAYQQEGFEKFTDDASLCRNLGYPIAVVEGSINNYKITYPGDFERFRAEKEND